MMMSTRIRTVFGVVAWFALAFVASSHWIATAQQNQADADPRFTGISTSMDRGDLGVSRRRFEPGARSAWHHHTHGQLLYVEEGRARTQKRDQTLREMGPGESDYTAPSVEHWHGAAPNDHFIQVAVGFGSGITWLDKVTDEEYGGSNNP